MTILSSGNTYDLSDADLSKFVTNLQFDTEIQNVRITYNFLNDLKNDLHYGDKKSDRYIIFSYLFQPQLRSGLFQYVFPPSEPDELVDQLNLIV